MRQAKVFVHKNEAGILCEIEAGKSYTFTYHEPYRGPAISLALPLRQNSYTFTRFPPFFDGLLPEGSQLEALLKQRKIDARDYFSQLLAVGNDLVGAVSVKEVANG
jgi:serine/threonine-protein kinase HipA